MNESFFAKKDKKLQTHYRDGSEGAGGLKVKNSKIVLRNTFILLAVVFIVLIGSIFCGKEGIVNVNVDNVSRMRIVPVQIGPEIRNKKLECTNANSTDLNNCANEQLVRKTRNAVEKEEIEKADVCSVYLAPSSVPGGGMGMFTTEAVKKGGMILAADG